MTLGINKSTALISSFFFSGAIIFYLRSSWVRYVKESTVYPLPDPESTSKPPSGQEGISKPSSQPSDPPHPSTSTGDHVEESSDSANGTSRTALNAPPGQPIVSKPSPQPSDPLQPSVSDSGDPRFQTNTESITNVIPQHGAPDIKIQTADNKSIQLNVNRGDININFVNGDSGDGEIADEIESKIPNANPPALEFQTAYNNSTQLNVNQGNINIKICFGNGDSGDRGIADKG